MTSVIAPIYKSVVRSVADFISDYNAENPNLEPMGYHDWESRGDEASLPHNTLLGVDGFSFNENQGMWIVRCALGLSSYQDVNLLKEIEILDRIHQTFGQGKTVRLLNMCDGSEQSVMAVSEFEILPMGQSEIRNYRTVGLELLRTGT